MTAGEKLSAALAWAARGFRVFRLEPNGKRPVDDGWPAWATDDPALIRAYWSADRADCNVGVLCDNLLVVDLDMKDGRNGVRDYLALGQGFDTLTVKTPSGGYHLYYLAGQQLPNSAGKVAQGIDTRSYHGFVVAPGSTIDGVPYRVEIDQPLAPAPAEIVRRVGVAREIDVAKQAQTELDTPAAMMAVVEFLQRAPAAVEGQRGDETTYRVCAEVRDRGVSQDVALELLLEHWNERCSPPWELEDLTSKVENVYRYAQNVAGQKLADVQFAGVALPPPEYEAATAGAEPKADPFAVQLGNLLPAQALAPRPWVYGGLLLRGDVSILGGRGGIGKSSVILAIHAHLAMGLDFMGFQHATHQPENSLCQNSEDSLEELSMRLHAVCLRYGFNPELVAQRVALMSSRGGNRFKLATGRGGSADPILGHGAALQSFIAQAREKRLAMMSFDPFVRQHEADENDNVAMTDVFAIFEAIAEHGDTSILLAHHASKGDGDDAFRGASAIRDSARVAMQLREADDSDCAAYSLDGRERWRYMKLENAKANKSARAETRWMEKHGVVLPNGESIGVALPADMRTRGDALRRRAAGLIVLAMRRAGAATFVLAEAAKVLQREDDIWRQQDVEEVRRRIDQWFTRPCEIETGETLTSQQEGHRKILVLS